MVLDLREFENRLKELVGLVETGAEEITITRGAEPIAILSGVPRGTSLADRAAALQSIRPGNGERFSAEWQPVRGFGTPASEIIREERAERF